MLQKRENLKDHPMDYSTGVIIIVDNNYDFHRYLDSESVSLFLYSWMFFIHLNTQNGIYTGCDYS